MKIKTKCRGDCLIVRLNGELDMASVQIFKDKVIPALDKKKLNFLLLNLKNVSFIDSTGLGAILGRYRILARKGGGILLVGLKPQVKRIFSLSGMLKIMNVYDSEDKALMSLNDEGEYNFA